MRSSITSASTVPVRASVMEAMGGASRAGCAPNDSVANSANAAIVSWLRNLGVFFMIAPCRLRGLDGQRRATARCDYAIVLCHCHVFRLLPRQIGSHWRSRSPLSGPYSPVPGMLLARRFRLIVECVNPIVVTRAGESRVHEVGRGTAGDARGDINHDACPCRGR